MDVEPRLRARQLIVTGYVATLIGSLLSMYQLTRLTFTGGLSFNFVAQYLLAPVVAIASLWGWWWISKLEVTDAAQRHIARMAFYGFSAQTLISGLLLIDVVLSVNARDVWNLDAYFVNAAGAFISALGFFAMARALTTSVVVEPVESESDAS